MFSYTDDAIVTSSPTGRHLSTVIRHPAGMPDDQWRKHADQVCTVLNELDSKAKLSLHLQTVGRVYRTGGPIQSDASYRLGEQIHEELEKQLDDATTKLAAAQMLLEKPIELGGKQLGALCSIPVGSGITFDNRDFKRVE